MSHEHEKSASKNDAELPDLFGISALDVHGDEPCLVQGAKMGATAFIAGSLFGGIQVYWKDIGDLKKGRFAAFQSTIKTIGNYGGLFALVGATFGATYCALQNSRTKNDPWNSVIASCAAGSVIGARVNGTVFGSVVGCGLTASLAGMGEFFEWTLSPVTPRLVALREQRRERYLRSSGAAAPEAETSGDSSE